MLVTMETSSGVIPGPNHTLTILQDSWHSGKVKALSSAVLTPQLSPVTSQPHGLDKSLFLKIQALQP